MTIVIPLATSVASAMLVFILQSVIKENYRLKTEKEKEMKDREASLEAGVKCLLRSQLISDHLAYMSVGHIETNALNDWLEMYNAYHGLNGNGTVERLKVELQNLHNISNLKS